MQVKTENFIYKFLRMFFALFSRNKPLFFQPENYYANIF